MSNFKVGDKVRKKDGLTFSNGKHIASIRKIGGDTSVRFLETGTWLPMDEIVLVEDKSKYHPHHDVIVAWAKGAAVECYSESDDRWVEIEPYFNKRMAYRIKPEKGEAELEKEEIVAEMERLKERLEKLEVK